MNNKMKICSFIAGLILSALILLFIHSETDLLHSHTENCRDIDLCLILDKARFNDHQILENLNNLTINYFHINCHDIFPLNIVLPNKDYYTSIHFITTPSKELIKNSILLI